MLIVKPLDGPFGAEILGLVGESGSGKTMVCRSLIGKLRRRSATIFAGSIMFDGMDLATLEERRWRAVRGRMRSASGAVRSTSVDPGVSGASSKSESVMGAAATRRTAG